MRRFREFAVIDWSGQHAPRPKGLAVALAGADDGAPRIVRPAAGRWSRQAILEWLLAQAGRDILIGLDLSPALPFIDLGSYFPGWREAPATAKDLWREVDERSAATAHLSSNGFLAAPDVREHFLHHDYRGRVYAPANGRLRRCEVRQRDMQLAPASCFKLIGPNQVGKSSLTGMRVLHRLGGAVPIWPFDPVPENGPLIVEIYTSLAARDAKVPAGSSKIRDAAALDRVLGNLASKPHQPLDHYDDHLTDALLTAAWLRGAANRAALWKPAGLGEVAATEGWTFGVL